MKVTDPVCGMRLDSDRAAGSADWQGRTWYFCSGHCRQTFLVDPPRYAGGPAAAGGTGAAPGDVS